MDKAYSESYKVEEDLEKIKDHFEQAKKELAFVKDEARKSLEDASNTKNTMIANAKAEGKKIVQSSTDNANKIIKDANNRVIELTKESEKLLVNKEELSSDLNKLNHELDELRVSLGLK